MREWLEGLAGPEYAMAVLWTLAALVGLVVILLIVRLIRSLTFGTFVAGGRNRKTRLAVMDATAVDSHRRLVLVRRDDVEHLLLIGGPTDVVVEQDIRLSGQVRRPAPIADTAHPTPQPRPRAVEPTRPPELRPQPAPRPQQPVAPRTVSQVPHEPKPAPQRLPPAPQPQRYSPPPPSRDDIDDALMKELEVELDSPAPPKQDKRPPISLDDEMQKLLGELSSGGRR